MTLVLGHYYRCRDCGLVYKRGNSFHPWASCGHPAARQEEVSECIYKRISKGAK